MTDPNMMINEQIQRIETALAGPDAPLPGALPDVSGTGLQGTFDVTLLEEEGRSVVARGDVVPGGDIDNVSLTARDGEDVARVDVEPDSIVCRAMDMWFERFWTSWDEILEDSLDDIEGEPVTLSALDLAPGDRVWRLDLTVATVEEAGVDTAGKPMVAVAFEDNPGREVWRAERVLTAIRSSPGSGSDDD